MPKGVALTEFEQGQVAALHKEGRSIREIAKMIKKSKSVVHNYLLLGDKYGTKKRSGRPSSLSPQDKRRIKHLAVNNTLSSSDIKYQLDLKVSARRVRQVLEANNDVKYKKSFPIPFLTPRHKKARFDFAEKYRFWENEWKNVVFSDEKKFKLDGPDSYSASYQDKRRPTSLMTRRNFGGGTVMIWAAFSFTGKTPLCIISTRMDSNKYIQLMEEVLIPFADENMDDSMIYQQDNASCHVSKVTKAFFTESNIPLLEWPALSPDLNPIENVWGLLAQQVFQHGRRYDTVRQLKDAIIQEWNKIDQIRLQSYIESMPKRLEEVIKNKGGPTHY